MRKPTWITKSGPYKCSSYHGGMELKASWPQYGEVWEAEEGGGPGIFGRMGLAADLEKWLNSAYTEEQIKEGHARIALHDANILKVAKKGNQKYNRYLLERMAARIVELEEALAKLGAGTSEGPATAGEIGGNGE